MSTVVLKVYGNLDSDSENNLVSAGDAQVQISDADGIEASSELVIPAGEKFSISELLSSYTQSLDVINLTARAPARRNLLRAPFEEDSRAESKSTAERKRESDVSNVDEKFGNISRFCLNSFDKNDQSLERVEYEYVGTNNNTSFVVQVEDGSPTKSVGKIKIGIMNHDDLHHVLTIAEIQKDPGYGFLIEEPISNPPTLKLFVYKTDAPSTEYDKYNTFNGDCVWIPNIDAQIENPCKRSSSGSSSGVAGSDTTSQGSSASVAGTDVTTQGVSSGMTRRDATSKISTQTPSADTASSLSLQARSASKPGGSESAVRNVPTSLSQTQTPVERKSVADTKESVEASKTKESIVNDPSDSFSDFMFNNLARILKRDMKTAAEKKALAEESKATSDVSNSVTAERKTSEESTTSADVSDLDARSLSLTKESGLDEAVFKAINTKSNLTLEINRSRCRMKGDEFATGLLLKRKGKFVISMNNTDLDRSVISIGFRFENSDHVWELERLYKPSGYIFKLVNIKQEDDLSMIHFRMFRVNRILFQKCPDLRSAENYNTNKKDIWMYNGKSPWGEATKYSEVRFCLNKLSVKPSISVNKLLSQADNVGVKGLLYKCDVKDENVKFVIKIERSSLDAPGKMTIGMTHKEDSQYILPILEIVRGPGHDFFCNLDSKLNKLECGVFEVDKSYSLVPSKEIDYIGCDKQDIWVPEEWASAVLVKWKAIKQSFPELSAAAQSTADVTSKAPAVKSHPADTKSTEERKATLDASEENITVREDLVPIDCDPMLSSLLDKAGIPRNVSHQTGHGKATFRLEGKQFTGYMFFTELKNWSGDFVISMNKTNRDHTRIKIGFRVPKTPYVYCLYSLEKPSGYIFHRSQLGTARITYSIAEVTEAEYETFFKTDLNNNFNTTEYDLWLDNVDNPREWVNPNLDAERKDYLEKLQAKKFKFVQNDTAQVEHENNLFKGVEYRYTQPDENTKFVVKRDGNSIETYGTIEIGIKLHDSSRYVYPLAVIQRSPGYDFSIEYSSNEDARVICGVYKTDKPLQEQFALYLGGMTTDDIWLKNNNLFVGNPCKQSFSDGERKATSEAKTTKERKTVSEEWKAAQDILSSQNNKPNLRKLYDGSGAKNILNYSGIATITVGNAKFEGYRFRTEFYKGGDFVIRMDETNLAAATIDIGFRIRGTKYVSRIHTISKPAGYHFLVNNYELKNGLTKLSYAITKMTREDFEKSGFTDSKNFNTSRENDHWFVVKENSDKSWDLSTMAEIEAASRSSSTGFMQGPERKADTRRAGSSSAAGGAAGSVTRSADTESSLPATHRLTGRSPSPFTGSQGSDSAAGSTASRAASQTSRGSTSPSSSFTGLRTGFLQGTGRKVDTSRTGAGVAPAAVAGSISAPIAASTSSVTDAAAVGSTSRSAAGAGSPGSAASPAASAGSTSSSAAGGGLLRYSRTPVKRSFPGVKPGFLDKDRNKKKP